MVDGGVLAGRLDGGVQHALGDQGIGEVGQGDDRFAAAEDGEDVGGLVDEAVLVAEAVAVGPPRRGVRVAVAAAGDVDRGPPLEATIDGGVVELELVHPLEVEAQRAALTVDLEAVGVVIAGGEAAAFEAGEGAAAEAGEEQHGVVDGARSRRGGGGGAGAGDLTTAAGRQHGPLGDEGVLDGAFDGDDLFAGDEAHDVDDVGVEVAVRARAGDVTLEPPQQRGVGPAPALEVRGAHVEQPSERALGHELVGEGDRRHASVVEPHEGPAHRGGGRRRHRLGVGERAGERLLAGDVLAGLEGGDRLLGVDVVRRGDVDEVDVVGGDRGAPVGGRPGPAPAGGEGRQLVGVAGAHEVHRRRGIDVEEVAHVRPGVGVGAAHELGADEGDVDRVHEFLSADHAASIVSTPR